MKPLTGKKTETMAIIKQEGINRLDPLKAIRAKCMDCSGDNSAEIRTCEIYHCALWPYRMGFTPHRTRPKKKK